MIVRDPTRQWVRVLTTLVVLGFPALARADAPTTSPATAAATSPATREVPTVRVAALGGLNDLDFWPELAARFEAATKIHIETVVTGNKDVVAERFKAGGIDLITTQSPDAIVGLVADGYATNATPWAAADLVIVGPAADPAGIRGMTDAAAAVRKIVSAKAEFVVHGSLGADVVVRGVLQADKGLIDPRSVTVLLEDHQKRVLQAAVDRKAYTLIARVPFRTGKLAAPGYEVMVEGDPILRRPIVAAVGNPDALAGTRTFEARRLLEFLRSPDTQDWVRAFGAEKLAGRPAFYAVAGPTTRPATAQAATVRVVGEQSGPLAFDAEALAKLSRRSATAKDRSGKETVYEGVQLRDLLRLAGAPLGDHRMRGSNLSYYVTIEAADGYRAVFALAEFDVDFADRSILLADCADGVPLGGGEGPFRVIVPGEVQQSRWVRRVTTIRVKRD